MDLTNTYNLKVLCPEIARQWHPDKNNDLTPDQVTPGSGRRIWWICPRGHEWESKITIRTRGCGCPRCGSNTATKEHNLMILRPDIADQWHPEKNGFLTPEDVTPVSKRKVWWECSKGHEWVDVIRARIKYNNGCPYCNGIEGYREYNLSSLHPDIASQWHPTKNSTLTPEDVTPGSARKVWWVCEKGHEWRAIISTRISGANCPYCSGFYPSPSNNLQAKFPKLARQWHPTKNKWLKPSMVTQYSGKKVWWQCDKGHEWQAVVESRTFKNDGCPYCSGKRASKEYNLLKNYPEIAKQWHPEKNHDLTPDKVTPGSDKKVWWICEKGHEWQATVRERSIQGNGCPYCAGKRASKEYNLLKMYPEIARQWHPKKNRDLTPDKVTPGSGKKVWWVCDKGHEWQTTICERSSRGSGCPYCAGSKASKEYNLLKIYPEIARQWHPVKNGQLTPDKVTPGSKKKVWWLCAKGHEWESTIDNRMRRKSPCPFCSRKKAGKEYNFSVFYPEIAKQWHPVKNGQLTPDKVTPGSKKKVWWLCEKGHEWEAAINSKITNKNRCPLCSRIKASKEYNLSVVCPEVARQWHPTKNRDLTPDKVTPGSSRKVWWQCDKGHEWQATIGARYYKSSGCPYCAGRRKK
jgi:hypothetical protein